MTNNSINLHGTITENNYDKCILDTKLYGPSRVQLSLHLKAIFDKLALTWILDSGNLLGAYRNGKMIQHDDDFDFGIYVPNLNSVHEKMEEYLEGLCTDIKKYFLVMGLNNKYQARVITDYAYKVEVFEPAYGKYPFRDTDFHNVTCDLTLILDYKKEGLKSDTKYVQIQHYHQKKFLIKREYLVPLSSIRYENNVYKAPNKVKEYLESNYGYIGENAVFDEKSGLYIEKTKVE